MRGILTEFCTKRHQLGDQQRPAPARQRVRVHVLDAIVVGAEAPEQVSELRGERRVDPGELSGQFVALGPGLLVDRAAADRPPRLPALP
jgi:hypothetical protein